MKIETVTSRLEIRRVERLPNIYTLMCTTFDAAARRSQACANASYRNAGNSRRAFARAGRIMSDRAG
jgi:hypothetical protein